MSTTVAKAISITAIALAVAVVGAATQNPEVLWGLVVAIFIWRD